MCPCGMLRTSVKCVSWEPFPTNAAVTELEQILRTRTMSSDLIRLSANRCSLGVSGTAPAGNSWYTNSSLADTCTSIKICETQGRFLSNDETHQVKVHLQDLKHIRHRQVSEPLITKARWQCGEEVHSTQAG